MLRVLSKLLLLSTLFFISSCAVETLDDSSITESKEVVSFRETESTSCKLLIKGKVLNATDLTGIQNAKIKILGGTVGSDHNGYYELLYDDARDYLTGKQFIKVTRGGFVYSTFEFDPADWIDGADCENSVTEVKLDFVLTPIRDHIVITPNGGNYTFTDESECIINQNGVQTVKKHSTELTLIVPPGAVRHNTNLSITTLNYDQYLGTFDKLSEDYGVIPVPLKRFSFSPANIEFEKSIKLVFDPEIPLVENDYNYLNYYRLDGNNEWLEEPSTNVRVNPSGKVEVRTKHLGNVAYVGNNTNGYKLYENLTPRINYQPLYDKTFENCDCSNGFMYKDVYRNHQWTQLTDQVNDLDKRLLAIRLIKILLNVPSDQLIEIDIKKLSNQGFVCLDDSEKEFHIKGLVEKCDIERIQLIEIKQSVSGMILGIEVNYIRDIAVERDIDNSPCPSSTKCHQGCPG
ncbi:MAG TPA: hypothetical protein ENK52_02470 [Saprospiraceae bacterium]|nr:hypothetical protein [Saprospiraceae bacterium]